jgi:hypothetical protein
MQKSEVKTFMKDVKAFSVQPISAEHTKLFLKEYPFDPQLITLSPLYRRSRQLYLKQGGKFAPSVCSTMRSLSTHDLFKNEIEYSPMHSEIMWLAENARHLPSAAEEIKAVKHFHDISIFHEQNHRILWKQLPPAPTDQDHLRRYLNFAESLVVALDLALADQVEAGLSKIGERLSLFYRPAGAKNLKTLSKKEYRQYLFSAFYGTYLCLERIHDDDVLRAANYVRPENKKINRAAVRRALELNKDFTEVTNPQWQQLYGANAARELGVIHKNSKRPVLFLPEDPLDLDQEFTIVKKVFDLFEV